MICALLIYIDKSVKDIMPIVDWLLKIQSLIANGMDQNKTNVPSLVRTPKSCQSLWTLRTHLTGVLVHGSGSYCYFDCLQWPHDCNLTLTCILNTLSELSKHRSLPPKLLLQMDNCVRENKNKYVYIWILITYGGTEHIY